MNMSKRLKKCIFPPQNNFFLKIYLELFQQIWNQREILHFWYPFGIFEEQFFFALFSIFSKL